MYSRWLVWLFLDIVELVGSVLAEPPAWTGVWICPDPHGHMQASGRDALGRKQYRYHVRWRASREATKFDRMQAFGAALPRLRARTRADLARPGLPRVKVLATVVQLLERTLIRIGNDEYAREPLLRADHAARQACRSHGIGAPVRVPRQERQAARGQRKRPAPRPHRRAVPRPAGSGALSVHRRGVSAATSNQAT